MQEEIHMLPQQFMCLLALELEPRFVLDFYIFIW